MSGTALKASPESSRPLLLIAALLLGVGALIGQLAQPTPPPLRTVGETGYLAASGDGLLLVNAEDYQASIMTSGCLTNFPWVRLDKDRAFSVAAGTAVKVIDTSHDQLTQVRVLDGKLAGREGWARIGSVIGIER